MHSMTKRHSVAVLREAGLQQREGTELTGVSERSVRRNEGEPVIQSQDDAAERARRAIGRPSKVEPWREKVSELLKAQPRLQGLEVLRRIRLDGYGGARSALYELIKELRPKDVRAAGHPVRGRGWRVLPARLRAARLRLPTATRRAGGRGGERVSATVKARDARRPQFDVKFETAGVKYLDTSPEASPPSVTAPHTVVETLRRSPASADSLRP